LDVNPKIWEKKKVLVTGHTGFKGIWLSFYLKSLGAEVIGLSLGELLGKSLYKDSLSSGIFFHEEFGDIRDKKQLESLFNQFEIDYVFHLAAQSLVRKSVKNPIETFETNIIGTANVVLTALESNSVKGLTVVTTDKVYENLGKTKPFTENERLGGDDPYSASKSSAELVVHALDENNNFRGIPITTVRAGNVIGGGDWSEERLISDIVKAYIEGKSLILRFPDASRPWQYILDCLSGYLLVGESHLKKDQNCFVKSVNFGPIRSLSVGDLVEIFIAEFGKELVALQEESEIEEKRYLEINSDLARVKYGWTPKFEPETAIRITAEWYSNYLNGKPAEELIKGDIKKYLGRAF
jgi:CDP-glucose 4,6-dehydratase